MKKTFRPRDVSQGSLLPLAPKDLLPGEHLSHFIRDLVRDELNLAAIHAHYVELRGYPPHHPAMMNALLLYGYCRGVFSSPAEQIKDLTGSYPAQISADAGYCSEANIVAVEERKVDPYIATGRQATARQV